MTRDEAVDKVVEPDAGYDFQFALIDSLVALGILKLDEPKSPVARLCEALGGDADGNGGSILSAGLRKANLKIVEK